ncbi:MAG: phospholipase [Gammaproteobacteria bacterium]|nr:phospholipase [Gammaproteobacteria bacterium]
MPITEGNITIHLGPTEQGAPDSLIEPIVDFIDRTRRRQRLMIAVQEVDHRPIAEAIINARKRGASIDLVIEQDYLLGGRMPDDPFASEGRNEANRFLFNAILRSTVDVKSDFNTSIFHQKFMVRGNSVLTGSTNFTTTGISKNLNHVVVINDAGVANSYKREFREIQKGSFGKYSVDRDEKPKESRVSNIRIKPLFAPDHSPEMEIMKQILKAKKRIDIAVFTFAQSSGIDDALIAASDRGVKVRCTMDSRQANQRWAASHGLKAAGIEVKLAGNKGTLGKLHHKLMTIDDNLTIFGSFNYTGPANSSNDENIIIVGDLQESGQAAKAAQKRIATASRKEIDRIIDVFGRDF